jgi:hypothetical protein
LSGGARRSEAGLGKARCGKDTLFIRELQGGARRCLDWPCWAAHRKARRGADWFGGELQSGAWRYVERRSKETLVILRGMAWKDTVRHCFAGQGAALQGMVEQSRAWRGAARHGLFVYWVTKQGEATRGRARRSAAWTGMAQPSEAARSGAKQGKVL